MLTEKQEEAATLIVDAAFKVHRAMGPGLLEKIYEACLEYELKKSGLKVDRQLVLPVYYDNLVFDEGLRLDLLVENEIIIELKAAHQMHPVWEAQIISYLKLMDLHLGFLINFNVPLIKQGIHRFRI